MIEYRVVGFLNSSRACQELHMFGSMHVSHEPLWTVYTYQTTKPQQVICASQRQNNIKLLGTSTLL